MSAGAQRIPFAIRELAGAFGDLGTFLPLVVGMLAVSGLAGSGAFAAFGIAYLMTALVYRAPIPVQPMKVTAAVAISASASPGMIAGAALALALFFLAAGASGLIARLASWVPEVATGALQVGLGISLFWLSLGLLADTPSLGAAMVVVLSVLLVLRPEWPVAVILLLGGVIAGQWLGISPDIPIPAPEPGWPSLHWPTTTEIARGTLELALPQIPLTLTNAILVTAAVGRDYFPHARRLDGTRLAITTGAMNLVAAPLGGIPSCHGAGGIAAHYRFGARTVAAPLIIGTILLALGLGWGNGASALLTRVPDAALGALLIVPAIDLVRAAKPLSFTGHERLVLVGGAAVAVWSPGIAFIAATACALLLRCRASSAA